MNQNHTTLEPGWRALPGARATYRALDRLRPTAPLRRVGPVRPLPEAPLDLAGLAIPDGRGGRLDWDGFLDASHATGLLVAQAGIVRHCALRHGMTATDRHMAFSITKSVTGLVALIAADAGLVDLDAPAEALLPALAGTAFGPARLSALLDMTDGIPFDESYADPGAEIHGYSRGYWGVGDGGVRTRLAALSPRAAEPGRFAYRTPPADVLGWALEAATGAPLSDLVTRLLWAPMGAEADGALLLDTAGHAIGGTGLLARLADLARIGLYLLEKAPAALLEHLSAGGARLKGAGTRDGWSYAGLWWNAHDARGSLMALGVHGQRLVVERETGTVIARFGAQPEAANTSYDALHAAAFQALAARLKADS